MTISEKVRKQERPIRVLQFGEGNFLRGFVDYMIDIANEKGLFDGGIVLVKPIPFGSLSQFPKQDYNYTVSLRGRVDGEPTVIERIVTVSGAGIAAPKNLICAVGTPLSALIEACGGVQDAVIAQ